MTSIKVILNRSRALKDGSYPLVVQIIHRRRKRLLYLSISLFPDEFDPYTEKILIGSRRLTQNRVKELNSTVHRHIRTMHAVLVHLDRAGTPYTVEDILYRYRLFDGGYFLLSWFDYLTDTLRQQKRFGTVLALTSTRASLAAWIGDGQVCLPDVDSRFVRSYEAFLLGRGVSTNTVCYYLRNLRSIWNRAREEGLPVAKDNPFVHIRTSSCPTPKRAVGDDVFILLAEADLSFEPAMDVARDIFMFSFYCRGMSFVDIAYLAPDNISDGYICYRRHKTGQQLMVGITPKIDQIVAKYRTSSPYIFPFVSGSTPEERHRSYRRASRARAIGTPVAVISECLGHTSERTTRVYLKEFDRKVIDEVNEKVCTFTT